MKPTFEDIKTEINKFNPVDLILSCYHVLDTHKDKRLPIWAVFLLIKWCYLYSDEKEAYQVLTNDAFSKILNSITNFNDGHISAFMKNGEIAKGFHILYHQQFYLQRNVYNQIFETQLKLYCSIHGRHDMNHSFKSKTGLDIVDFLKMLKIFWLYVGTDISNIKHLNYDGHIENNFLEVLSQVFGKGKVVAFVKQLLMNPINPVESIKSFKRGIEREDLQIMETTFFTMFPFQLVRGQIKLIHESVIKYAINYYVYDYLKSTDEKFTTDFGYRIEKYVEFGLNEMSEKYELESALKKKLPKHSKVVDFLLVEQNIFIECKATELQPYPAVNPLDGLLINSLKSSLLKAYFEQLIPVAKILSPGNENWGIIITYKELFWSRFAELFELGKDIYSSASEFEFMPYDNVFIIDIYTWDKVVQIVKDKKATLLDILKLAKENNSDPKTSKQTFDMHLDTFNLRKLNLSYLNQEHDLLDFKSDK